MRWSWSFNKTPLRGFIYSLKKKKSVLIGHVFGFSAENVNSPRSRTSIAFLSVPFSLFLRFCFIFVDLSGFILRRQTVLCTMAVRPRATFAHTKTVRLIVEDGMEITALEIVPSLLDFKEEITGIVPNVGGKCFDITL